MKRWQTFLIGLVISAIFLFLALRQAQLSRIVETFRTARYEFVALCAGLIVLNALARGLRWSVLNRGYLPTADAVWLSNIGALFNNVLPARLGEFARAALAGRRPRVYFVSALSSIVVERLFDLVSLCLLLVMVLLVLPLPPWATTAGIGIGSGALLGLLILAIAARWPIQTLRLSSHVFSRLPTFTQQKANALVARTIQGLSGVSDLRTFGLGLGLSVAAWLMSGVTAWVLMLAFWPHAPLMVGYLAVVASGLGMAVPAAPSGFGPFQAAIISVLVAINYDADASRSYAFALHLLNFLMTSLLGGVGLIREGSSFHEVARLAKSLHDQELPLDSQDLPGTSEGHG